MNIKENIRTDREDRRIASETPQEVNNAMRSGTLAPIIVADAEKLGIPPRLENESTAAALIRIGKAKHAAETSPRSPGSHTPR